MALGAYDYRDPNNALSQVDLMNRIALGPIYTPRDPNMAPMSGGGGSVFRGPMPDWTMPVGAMSRPDVPMPNESLPSGVGDRVSTAVPTAKGTTPDPHTTAQYEIDHARYDASTDAKAANAETMRGYDDLPLRGMRNPDNITNVAVQHFKNNLIDLHNRLVDTYGEDFVNQASLWYDGANALAHRLADESGYSPRQVAAAMANLSPQKDWYQNADLAKRLIDVASNPDRVITPQMKDWADGYVASTAGKADTPTKQAALDDMRMMSSASVGTRFGDLNDPTSRAFWARAYDEAHNSKDYPEIMPTGETGDTVTTGSGAPRKIGWGSFGEISKALSMLDPANDSLEAISRSLGGNHKVRSFYNNIISPDAPNGDVTIDTHAIAAAHGRPLSGNDPEVAVGLGTGGSKDSATGSKGTYAVYADAYRQAAAELGLQPRQLQSITWEGIRSLFSPAQKRDPALVQDVNDLWSAFKDRQADLGTTQQAVFDRAGGFQAPSWWRPRALPEPEK